MAGAAGGGLDGPASTPGVEPGDVAFPLPFRFWPGAAELK